MLWVPSLSANERHGGLCAAVIDAVAHLTLRIRPQRQYMRRIDRSLAVMEGLPVRRANGGSPLSMLARHSYEKMEKLLCVSMSQRGVRSIDQHQNVAKVRTPLGVSMEWLSNEGVRTRSPHSTSLIQSSRT
ncbi:hypothetical protein OG21DRAFT_2630 [Imleria badia]|nr:hypothetical protein OG21DRAFT_2630 [Imleria badia]